MKYSALGILSLSLLAGTAHAAPASYDMYAYNYAVPAVDVTSWVTTYIEYSNTFDIIAAPAFVDIQSTDAPITITPAVENYWTFDPYPIDIITPTVETTPTIDDIDIVIESICRDSEELETPSAELEEANRLWILAVLSDDEEDVCTSPDDEGSERFCAPRDEENEAPANPNLSDKTEDQTVILALPAVKSLIQNFPARRARLNKNVIPQIIALLDRKNEKLLLRAIEVLEIMGSDLTDEGKAEARKKLEALKKANPDNKTLVTAIDSALKKIPEPKK